jgi:hypothetical protein
VGGETSIVWVTGPLSPGLSILIEIETLTGAAGGVGSVGLVGVLGVVGWAGAATATEASVPGAGSVSACAGRAKKVAESAAEALPARAMRLQVPITKRIARSSPLSFRSEKYPPSNRNM